jgi:hypothetical protein
VSLWIRLFPGSTKSVLELNSTWPIRVKEEIILNYKLKYSASFFNFQPILSNQTPTHSKAPTRSLSSCPSVPQLSRDVSAHAGFQRVALDDRTTETVNRQTNRLRTTPFQLSATAHSVHSQLPSIMKTVSPPATWGRDIPWSQGPTYHGLYT